MIGFQINEMQNNDLKEVLQLWKESPGIALSPADSIENLMSFLVQNQGLCFVARKKNKLVGAVLGGCDTRRGYLYHLAVNKAYRQMGVGKTLTEKVLAALKARNIQKCHIFVIADNLEGLHFWQKTGWKKRDDVFVMSYDL